MNAAIKVLDSRSASMQQGEMDDMKGRALQRALRDWAADVATGRKALKKASPELKIDLNKKIVIVDKAFRCLTKFKRSMKSAVTGAYRAMPSSIYPFSSFS